MGESGVTVIGRFRSIYIGPGDSIRLDRRAAWLAFGVADGAAITPRGLAWLGLGNEVERAMHRIASPKLDLSLADDDDGKRSSPIVGSLLLQFVATRYDGQSLEVP